MKVVTKEERDAQLSAVYGGALKGLVIGATVSLGIYGLARYRYSQVFKLTTSAQTAIFVTPPAFFVSLYGELSSNNFDKHMYSSEESQKEVTEEYRKWNALSSRDKVVTTLNNNKYKIITGLWALSLWGSWEYVNRDKLLTKAQKFYDARMYAQFVTILLLLGSIGLSMADEEKEKTLKTTNDRDFQRVLSGQNSRE